MAMCAGVQKVSRPIERCQETSHWPPIEADVTARAPAQMYQGTDVARAAARVLVAVASATKPGERAKSTDIEVPRELALMIRESLLEVPESNPYRSASCPVQRRHVRQTIGGAANFLSRASPIK